MDKITQKHEIGTLDGTPDKRMYWSIISDYDIKTGICELIDNAIDLWHQNKNDTLIVEITLDSERQLIQIKDNAGGVAPEDLRALIAPGVSKNSPIGETIGIFGVGSKRAVVALAENVSIKTRRKDSQSYQIDLTRDWLESSDWNIPYFEIPQIDEGVTIINLSALRKSFNQEDIVLLIDHLSETYDSFLRRTNPCRILVNRQDIKPKNFENWAYLQIMNHEGEYSALK